MAEQNGRVRFHRRIGVRLAVVLAVMLTAFSYSQRYLADLVVTLFAPYHENCVIIFPNEGEDASPEGKQWEEEWAAQVAAAVKASAQQDDSGGWMLPASGAQVASALLAAQDASFAWLDLDLRILAASESLHWKAGEVWTFGTQSHTDIDIPGDSKHTLHAVYVPISHDGHVVGTFAWLDLTPIPAAYAASHAAGADGSEDDPYVVTVAEYRAQKARRENLIVGMKIAISLVIALLLGGLLSLLVTRPVRRLALVAQMESHDDTGLPGPFHDRGRDEIALLARSMNAMRSRAAELLNDLKDQDAARREWIALVAHDLRTPLTALLACMDRADTKLAGYESGPCKGEMQRLFTVARADADRVKTLSDDLIEIARLDAYDPLDLEDVPPGELVSQGVLELEAMAAQAGLDLQVTIPRDLPVLRADGRRLMRALMNLLRNALQHAKKRVQVSVAVHGDAVRFEVSDDGPGFAGQCGEFELESIEKSRGGDSVGLGLAVACKVAKAHGGHTGGRNLGHSGASAWMTIPVTEEREEGELL